MLHREPFAKKRFAFGLLLAHLAAAYAMGFSMLATAGVASVFNADTYADGLPSLGSMVEGIVCFPLVALAIAMPAAILLIPYSFVGALISWPIVAMRCVGAAGATTIGAVLGVTLGALCLWRSASVDGLAEHWVAGVLLCEVDAMATGTAFGWVIWRVAIRKRNTGHGRSATTLSPEPLTT